MMRLIVVALTSLLATSALADTPFYVGGGLGYSKIAQDQDLAGFDDAQAGGLEISNLNFDDDDTGLSLFAGYEITERWAVEAGYIDFGDAKDNANVTFSQPPGSNLPPAPEIPNGASIKFEMDGYYVNGQYHIPVSNYGSLDLIGGWFFGDSRTTGRIFEDTLSDSNTDSGVMAGVAFTLKTTDTIYVRFSGMYFQLDFDDVVDEPLRLGADVIWDF